MELIYHRKFSGIVSEFDKSIMDIASNNEVLILCPYISYDYLVRLIKKAKGYKIITDINGLFSNTDPKIRKKFIGLIKDDSSHFRHFKGLHAKAICSKEKALIGSANLTTAGVRKNLEVSVLIKDKKSCKELADYFMWVWSEEAEKINLPALQRYSNTIIKKAAQSEKLYDDKPCKINARLSNRNLSDEERLTKSFSKFHDVKNLNKYLNLVRDMFTKMGIRSTSPGLFMSIRKNDSRIPITIGQRYIIAPGFDGSVEAIMPLDYPSGLKYPRDKPSFFTINKQPDAQWVGFDSIDEFFGNRKLINYWYKAIEHEIERVKTRSSHREKHSPDYYQAVMDNSFRNRIIKKSKRI